MSLSVEVGLLLALATSFASVVGFLYKQRGAIESPAVELRRPVRTSLALFRSRWYMLGIAIAVGSWGLHVSALSLAPISLVQSVIAGGLVLLTVTAHGLFDHDVTRREWIGVGLAALAYSAYDAARLWPWVGALSVAALVVAATSRDRVHEGVILGASAGLFWAASDTSIKALTDHLGDGAAALLLNPLAAVIALASFAGLAVSARSLQLGKAVPVIAVTSVAANLFTIAAGPIVFGEPMPNTSLGLLTRLLAFALVISAAALTPAPVRAAEPDPAA